MPSTKQGTRPAPLSRVTAERLEREARALGVSSARLLETIVVRFLLALAEGRREVERMGREQAGKGAKA
jgi:hypothetical protein